MEFELIIKKKKKRRKVFIVPNLGKITERGAVVATPQYSGRFYGRCLVSFQISDSQGVPLTPTFIDNKGNPATVDGQPEWLVDNPNVIALTPAADGLSCDLAAVGPLGTAIVSMKADADLGAGVEPLVGTFEIEVTAGKATTVVLTPGDVTER